MAPKRFFIKPKKPVKDMTPQEWNDFVAYAWQQAKAQIAEQKATAKVAKPKPKVEKSKSVTIAPRRDPKRNQLRDALLASLISAAKNPDTFQSQAQAQLKDAYNTAFWQGASLFPSASPSSDSSDDMDDYDDESDQNYDYDDEGNLGTNDNDNDDDYRVGVGLGGPELGDEDADASTQRRSGDSYHYLAGFAADLSALSQAQIDARCGQYADSVDGSYFDGAAQSAYNNGMRWFTWIAGFSERGCDKCSARDGDTASYDGYNSPTWSDGFTGFPGDGDFGDGCDGGCQCEVGTS